MTVIASSTRVLAHMIRARHRTTKAPVAIRGVFKNDVPRSWRITTTGGVVVVSRDPSDRAPAAPVVVTITSADETLRLEGGGSADVTLTQAEHVHDLVPLPSVVEVRLVKKTNVPSTGRTVTVRPSSGTAVPLPEVGATGVYRSAARVWDAAFSPLDVRVGNASARRVPYDPTSAVQRLRLVDPT